MKDSRLTKLADICVNFSTKVQPGDYVQIVGDYQVADSFINLLYEKTLEAGGNPIVTLQSKRLMEIFYKKVKLGYDYDALHNVPRPGDGTAGS